MFSKSLSNIGSDVPVNSLIIVKSNCSLTETDTGHTDRAGTIFGIIKTDDGTFVGTKLSPVMSIYALDESYLERPIHTFEPDVKAYKPVTNPTEYPLAVLTNFIVTRYEQVKASKAVDKFLAEEEKRKAKEKLEADIKALKLKLRAERKADFFNNMRPVIADEARKVLEQISVEQHDEVIATITEIVNKVADEIVVKNYKLVDDYYNQAYLQLVQLEESIGEKILKSADKNVSRILAATQQQMTLMANEVAGISEKSQKAINRMENLCALKEQAMEAEIAFLSAKLNNKIKRLSAKPKAKATKKPVKKPAKKVKKAK